MIPLPCLPWHTAKKNGIRRQVLDRLALRKAMTNHVCWPSYLAHLLSTWGQNVQAETARFARINSRTSDEYLIPKKKNLIFRWASSCLPITGSTFAAQSFRDLCPTDFTSWGKKKRSPTHLLFIDNLRRFSRLFRFPPAWRPEGCCTASESMQLKLDANHRATYD